MKNIITITLDDTKAEHNFKKGDILLKQGIIFQKLTDLEEVRRI